MSDGYQVLSLDDLERLPSTDGALTLLPLRRTLGFRPFGVNAWLGAKRRRPRDRAAREQDGDEELYVVVRGRATFTLGDETFDAPAGTLVHATPGTLREATAAEDDTIVLAVGAKPGKAWEPAPWEDFYVAFAHRAAGRVDEARALVADTLARHPGTWQGPYNAACFEALAGDDDAAFAHLRLAHERAPDVIEQVRAATTATSRACTPTRAGGSCSDDVRPRRRARPHRAGRRVRVAAGAPPLRHPRFGVNAYAPGASGQVVEEHSESAARARGDLPRPPRPRALHGRRQRARARPRRARLRARHVAPARRGRR